MNTRFRRLYQDEGGQALYLVAALLVVVLGMAALSIDIGFALHGQRELQASADAAATAGGVALSNNDTSTQVINAAYCYSGVGTANFGGSRACPQSSTSTTATEGYNAINDLFNVNMSSGYPAVKCLTYLTNLGMACNNAALGNAIAVQETAYSPTFFGKLFGISSIKLTASSLSSMKGGTPAPANIMMVMDTTRSMQDSDSDATCASQSGVSNPTKEDCAKWGVRTFLTQLSPCAAGLTSCGTITGSDSTGFNVANPVDEVAVLTFPGMTSTTPYDGYEYDCQSTTLSTSKGIAPYSTSTSSPPYFTIVPLSSDYKTSDSGSLNAGDSPLVDTVSWLNQSGCNTSKYGLQDPGGVSTYYAGVLTEAQADLSALASTNPTRASMQNAIILLSDGDAEATSADFTGAAQTCCSPPIYDYECHQAVSAAQADAQTKNSAGELTWVYAIAFGASTTAATTSHTNYSCGTDGNPQPPIGSKTSPAAEPISGCTTMSEIASDPNKFYADGSTASDGSGTICSSPAHGTIASLAQIFNEVSQDFLTTRLLPWGTN